MRDRDVVVFPQTMYYPGGVDSSFSLLDARDSVTDLVFIHDFEVETNAKDVFRGLVSWAHFHGALLAAVALELQGRVSVVHVPSSADVGRNSPWGSYPLLDPHWSTLSTRLVHDRLDVTRVQKTAAIADEDVLLENLRVCWAPHQNCGWCGKCVRTVFTLQALERFEQGRPFDRPPVTAPELARLHMSTPGVARQFQQVADFFVANDRDPDLVRAVRIACSGWYHSPVGRLFRGDLRGRIQRRLRSHVRRA